MTRYAVLFAIALTSLAFWSNPALGECNQQPMIGSTAFGIEAFPEIDEESAVVQYNDSCLFERWTKVWLLEDGRRPVLLHKDGYNTNGWRKVTITGLTPGEHYCVAVETPDFQLPLTVSACFKTIYAPRVYQLDPVSNPNCNHPQMPNAWDSEYKEHVYLSAKAADELGINPASVSNQGPSPQVRILIDEDKVAGTDHPSAIYTVAGICTDHPDKPNRFWVWETSKLFGNAPPALPVRAKLVDHFAPHQTTDPLAMPVVTQHYNDPNSAGKRFEESIESAQSSSEVLVMAPHGGNIETGTSDQIPFFRGELAGAGTDSSSWDVSGKWGQNETYRRWHITSTAMHPDSFPGLEALLFGHGQFNTAVAFHGCSGSCNTDLYGVIVGGGTALVNKCQVVQRIEALAIQENRGGQIAYLIADTNANGDINLPSAGPVLDLGTVVGGNLSKLRGISPDNIVNRVSGGNGIQLEQTKELRDEENCGDTCLWKLVARGTALAVQDLLDATVPAGACQF